MTIQLQCNHCSHRFHAPSNVTYSIRCPACRHTVNTAQCRKDEPSSSSSRSVDDSTSINISSYTSDSSSNSSDYSGGGGDSGGGGSSGDW